MKRDLGRLADGVFDLVVVGGGINGAGVARDAAGRGFRTALVEADDFGSGTSGRSSKLVHGGLRYLEQGRLFQVRESLRERGILLRIAPHLVRPLPFLLPVYRGDRHGLRTLRVGLTLYDLLARDRAFPRHRTLDPSTMTDVVQGLRRDALLGGAIYNDAVTDDRRLTVLNALDAAHRGAVVANHLELTGARDGGDLVHLSLEDRIDGGRLEARARAVVNATGP